LLGRSHRSAVTLLVADDCRRALVGALAGDAAVVDAAGVADAVGEATHVVVVDAHAVPDTHAVVADVRERAPDAVVVVAGGADAGDVSCPTRDEQSVRAAVERARDVVAYRESVSSLYEACRGRALGRPDADLRACRESADDRFESLPEDREAVAAALRSDDDAADGLGGDTNTASGDGGADG
jgi:hypothetical protein